MSIQSEIDRLQAAKSAIAAALQAMGVEPPEGTTLDQYAAQLTAIAASAPWLPLSGGAMAGNVVIPSPNALITKNEDGVPLVKIKEERLFFVNGDGGVTICDESRSERAPVLSFYGIYGDEAVTLNNIQTPSDPNDAANKGYVDGLVGSINSALDAINGEAV